VEGTLTLAADGDTPDGRHHGMHRHHRFGPHANRGDHPCLHCQHGHGGGRHGHDDGATGRDGRPLAGYHGGLFYLRDRNDNFRLFLGGRLHVDSLNYFGPGVTDTALKSTVILRRARIEIGGELHGHWQFVLQMDVAPTAFENATGNVEQSAAPAGTDPTRDTATYAPVQASQYRARAENAYINYSAAKAFNVQAGQFNLPFTMENRTSTNALTFMERSMAVRSLGVPLVKDIGAMAWGALDRNLFFYSIGLFMGEGLNRPNADNRWDTAMRYYVRPLARSGTTLKEAQLGFSFKYGMRDKNRVAYDYTGMQTHGGYQFWGPTYKDSVGPGRLTHIIPSGAQTGVAVELRIPVRRLDLRGEFVHIDNNMREGVDGFQSVHTERFGKLKGNGYYVQLGYWLLGKPRITPTPGDQQPPHLDLSKPDPGLPPHAVEVAVRWEQLRAEYESASRDGVADVKNVDGKIKADAIGFAANYWATRHLRFAVDYVYTMFPGSAPTSATAVGGPTWSADQRALAPGNRLDRRVNDEARDGAHALHELTARLAVAF
jgi:phosphate-selective porin